MASLLNHHAITIENLVVRYDTAKVIDDLSLTIENGHFFTLLGPSGCGKTTLLRTLAGFVSVSGGRILFGPRDVSHLPAHQRDIGMVFQDYALFPDKSVFDNVAYGLRARNVGEDEIRKRVGEQLERVGLSGFPARRPAELSGGQRQRVALARALVIRPSLLLMDEPLSNLDAKLRVQVRETIADLQREARITTVFVTHDQEEALAMSDRIGLLKRGKLEQVGTPSDLYRTPVSAYVADFVGGANIVSVTLASALEAGLSREIRVGSMLCAATLPQALQAGTACLIARPEDIGIEPAADGAGTILNRQYLGSVTQYRIAIDGGVQIVVSKHGSDHERHNVGERVAVRLDPAKTLVVAQ